jgi:hypothetical protein
MRTFMGAFRRLIAGSFLVLAISTRVPAFAGSIAEPSFLYATQSGALTLDQGDGGGNPFASALVELLQRDNITFDALATELVALTRTKSDGFQEPEVPTGTGGRLWQVLPMPDTERRVALVLVFSDYSANAGST